MHYCFLSTGSWLKNGTLPRTRELGAALARLGVAVTFVLDDLPYNRDGLRLPEAAKKVFVPAAPRLGQFRRRAAALAEVNPDYLHLTPAPKLWLTARLAPNLKIVGDWDEWPAIRTIYGPAKRFVYRRADRWLRDRAVLRVVASRYMQRRFHDDFGQDSLYLPHASFSPDYPDGPSPFAAPTAVYMGTMFDFYDHDVLFEAALRLKQQGSTPPIEIIGDGPDLPRWQAFTRDHGLSNISLPGHLSGDALWQHLRHAHVLLFPLRPSEINACRCPGKLYYYAQVRRPVITTPVGENHAILGDLATYVPCDPTSFAAALRTAMATPRAPDVPYEQPTWDDRARALLDAIKTKTAADERR